MNIEIVTKNIENDRAVRTFVRRKIHFALDRVDARVESVTVRLDDEKAKTDGVFEGSCRIEVELHPRGHIHVSSGGESAFESVLQAVRKMERAVKHDLDRNRRSSRIRHQQTKRMDLESVRDDAVGNSTNRIS